MLVCIQSIPELAGTKSAFSSHRVSDSVVLGWGLIIYTSNKFPGAADAAHLGTPIRIILLGHLGGSVG